MTHYNRSLSSPLNWLVVLLFTFGTAHGLPLVEKLIGNSHQVWSYQQRGHRMTKRSPDRSFSSTLVTIGTQSLSVGEDEVTESTVIVNEPQCLRHHEYAQILPGGYIDRDSRVRSFVTRHNEVRYYICLACQSCPPGVQILSPCHRKTDTICSTRCVDPTYVYDPNQQVCLSQTSAQSTSTPTSAIHTSSLAWITTVERVFVEDDGTEDNSIDNAVNRQTTVPSTPHKALLPQITIITVGVLSLNVLVIAGISFAFKRSKCKTCKKQRKGFHNGRYNNALSRDELSVTLQPPSTCNQAENGTNTTEVVDEGSATPQIHGELEMFSAGSNQNESEVVLVPRIRAKESNLNIWQEPGDDEQGAQTILIPKEEELNLPASIQVLHGKDPYWLVMIGQFGPEGGILSSEYSDVILEIPPGAIPDNCRDQTIIAKISLCPDAVGPKLGNPDSLWLTPLVEFESPGLERFNKDVRMRLPHCARMKSGWTFQVNYTNPTAATNCNKHTDPTPSTISPDPEARKILSNGDHLESSWFSVQQKCHLSKSGKSCRKASEEEGDVTFTVDEKYFNVSTSHFSKYCCSGCHKEHPLHLESVVYWNHTKVEGHEQMDLNVYILDPIKDSRMKVKENERSSDCHTGYHPLILGYKKKTREASSLEICVLEDSMGDNWGWRLHTYNGDFPAKRVLKIQSVIRCCSPLLPSHQTFSLCPIISAEGKQPSLFQAIVCIKQQNSPDVDWTRILVNVPLLQERTDSPLPVTNSKERGTIMITDEDIEVVVDELPAREWCRLYRKLMGEGANSAIEHIRAKHPDNTREQIHEALLSWRMSHGPRATVKCLTEALDAVQLRAIAELLHLSKRKQGKCTIRGDIFKMTQV